MSADSGTTSKRTKTSPTLPRSSSTKRERKTTALRPYQYRQPLLPGLRLQIQRRTPGHLGIGLPGFPLTFLILQACSLLFPTSLAGTRLSTWDSFVPPNNLPS